MTRRPLETVDAYHARLAAEAVTPDQPQAVPDAEPTKRLYLDLDGVMADFDAHFPATFGLDHRNMADDAMWSTVNAHPSYFRDMPPCVGAIDFFREIAHLHPIILTACPRTNYQHVARQKREWVRHHLSPHVIVLPVMGGRNKPLFMQEPGDVLIDDWRKNIDAWNEAGGKGVLHRSFDKTRSAIAGEFAARPVLPVETPAEGLQEKVRAWTSECFGDEIACDVQERLDRFAEEAIELTQAVGYSRERWHALIAYVFDREPGDPSQEVGGTMTTLAALCNTQTIDIISAWRTEVDRITQPETVLKIRAKQAAKPTGSALPIATAPAPLSGRDGSLREAVQAARDLLSVERYEDGRVAAIGYDSGALRKLVAILDAALAAVPPETAEMEGE